mmetsp:Transcript_120888/g.341835  ORF Transcript_120888/g.341835 Transcript_120888/m.341835 type:complete len:524 (-) Transcript_120888:129-1700(-)
MRYAAALTETIGLLGLAVVHPVFGSTDVAGSARASQNAEFDVGGEDSALQRRWHELEGFATRAVAPSILAEAFPPSPAVVPTTENTSPASGPTVLTWIQVCLRSCGKLLLRSPLDLFRVAALRFAGRDDASDLFGNLEADDASGVTTVAAAMSLLSLELSSTHVRSLPMPLVVIMAITASVAAIYVVSCLMLEFMEGPDHDERCPSCGISVGLDRTFCSRCSAPLGNRGGFAAEGVASKERRPTQSEPSSALGSGALFTQQSLVSSASFNLGSARQLGSPPPSDPTPATSSALCPSLIVPPGTGMFSISVNDVKMLRASATPIEIRGPSGLPLLHAKIAPNLNSGAPGSRGVGGGATDGLSNGRGGAAHEMSAGSWLEVSTTKSSQYPHASIGPLPSQQRGANEAPAPLHICGPKSAAPAWFGVLEKAATGWQVKRQDRVVFSIDDVSKQSQDSRGTFTAKRLLSGFSVQGGNGGRSFGATQLSRVVERDGHVIRVEVNEGGDCMLVIITMLAVLVMTPDLLG